MRGKEKGQKGRPHLLPAHSHPALKQPSTWGYLYISVLSLISHHSFSTMYSTRHSSCLKELGVYWDRKICPQGSHTVLDAAWEMNSKGWEFGSPGEQARHLLFKTGRSPLPAGQWAHSTIPVEKVRWHLWCGQPLSGLFYSWWPQSAGRNQKWYSTYFSVSFFFFFF